MPGVGRWLIMASEPPYQPLFGVLWAIEGAIMLGMWIVVAPVWVAIIREGHRLGRMRESVFLGAMPVEMLTIVAFFPIWCTLIWLAIIHPRGRVLFILLARLYEMNMLQHFFHLMLSTVGGPNAAGRLLARLPEYKVFNTRPFCCFPCWHRVRRFDAFALWFCRLLVMQNAYFGPFAVIVQAFANENYVAFKWLLIVSTLGATYGFFILHNGMKQLAEIQNFRLNYKFICVRGWLVLKALVKIIFAFIPIAPLGRVKGETLNEVLQDFVVFCFMPVFAWLVVIAMRPSELSLADTSRVLVENKQAAKEKELPLPTVNSAMKKTRSTCGTSEVLASLPEELPTTAKKESEAKADGRWDEEDAIELEEEGKLRGAGALGSSSTALNVSTDAHAPPEQGGSSEPEVVDVELMTPPPQVGTEGGRGDVESGVL
uniref:Uncharacterized protein n=1 Tax=Chromera velia CCMP2878 TaxID=1169474 RepID=A0A0G4HKN8_9ALVE|eukprot:Cvel_28509.t1-p1 / transcript=Cvel_28509.t1 / gene=Cvel_28509 / organism=Chromera_velia_CCMP2878 / gene_product=hypothetical protein / transcript_product=hypothetical protein / location=Cvel_scaffold3747:6919-10003(-) / protein_length=428 / sequence_SO=supercontig / SO=protein_coding / is_pseudo=false